MDCTEWNERETNQDEVQCCRPLSTVFLLIHTQHIIIIAPLVRRETLQVHIYIYIIVNEIYRYLFVSTRLYIVNKNLKRGSDFRRQRFSKYIIVVG